MTLSQQFTTLATGSNLSRHFQSVRLKLMGLIMGLLLIVLIISGYSTFEANKASLNAARVQTPITLPRPGYIDLFQDYEVRTYRKALDQMRITIITSHVLLLVLLSTGAWISLYYLLKPLSDSHREQEQFLAEASHDLRTPLAILYSELSLAQTEKNTKSLQKTIRNSLTEIKRLRYLSDSLLAQVAGEKNEWEDVDVGKLVEEVWQKLSAANTKNIQLKIEQEKPVLVYTHKAHLYRIIYNILDNIAKYSDRSTTAYTTINTYSILFVNSSESAPGPENTGMLSVRRLSQLIGAQYTSTWEKGIYTTTLSFTTISK